MAKPLFPQGILKIEVNGATHLAEFMGRQDGFECSVCGKGGKCYTFNIIDTVEKYKQNDYETLGFGKDHLNNVSLLGVVDPNFDINA